MVEINAAGEDGCSWSAPSSSLLTGTFRFGSLLLLDLVVVHLNHYLEVLERYSLIDPGSDPLWRLTFLINWEFQTSVILHLSIIHLLPLVIIK